ncbi:MAG: SxtJ family membrane protein [Phycisphaerales bacterium]
MELRARLTAKEGRKFAFTLGIAFAVIGFLFAWRWGHSVGLVLWIISGVLMISGVLIPTRLGGVSRMWLALGEAISKVTSPIIMAIMYYLILTPVGFLMRLSGKNPLRHKEHDGGYWLPTKKSRIEDLENQF